MSTLASALDLNVSLEIAPLICRAISRTPEISLLIGSEGMFRRGGEGNLMKFYITDGGFAAGWKAVSVDFSFCPADGVWGFNSYVNGKLVAGVFEPTFQVGVRFNY